MSWTDERVEILKKLWGEGQSASQIAKELGGVTRNAVIGKVHRLGLSNRATSSSSSKSDSKTKASVKSISDTKRGSNKANASKVTTANSPSEP
ncbi:GcrA cell cycle regulator, partial [Paracoccaceae bacterium]|nr:GcrA cell cycle regulator [Paracoccaceae bacterium]